MLKKVKYLLLVISAVYGFQCLDVKLLVFNLVPHRGEGWCGLAEDRSDA